ncbi:MAG TPA: lytic transglycosylase domain-containing protein [Ktedonobacteraceae bacterium]|nr:lytic transglycosylase domain-containing protein [Ktedonobacteraceae bacterium]
MQQLRPFSQMDQVKAAARSGTEPVPTTTDVFSTEDQPQTAGLSSLFPDPSHAPADQAAPATPVTDNLLPVLQGASGITGPARPLVVIRAEKKRQKRKRADDAPARHLRPRYRQMIVLTALVLFLGLTLATLVPLAADQSPFSFFSPLGNLIHPPSGNLAIEALQTETASQGLPPLTLSRSQYVAIAEQDAINVGISPVYFVRQIQVESGFNPNAVSPSGAVGIAQFLPSTAAGLGINPWNPIQALQGAAKLMANLYHQYGDYAKALAAYNAGSANLNNAISACGANWLSCMPAETQHYVTTIMG